MAVDIEILIYDFTKRWIFVDKLCDLIMSARFDKANKIVNQCPKEAFETIIANAYDTESEMFYIFYLSKLIKFENAQNHYFVSLILAIYLNFKERIYDKALYHAKRAMELDKEDVSYKVCFLFFISNLIYLYRFQMKNISSA